MALVDELRTLSELELAELFFRRPELADPPPASFDDLAIRAGAPYSIIGCLAQVKLPLHQIISALAYLGEPSSARNIADLAGEPTDLASIVTLLDEGRRLGLLFRVAVNANEAASTLWSLTPSLARQTSTPFGLRQPLARVLDRYSVPDLRSIVANLGLDDKPRPKQMLIALIVEEHSNPERLKFLIDRLPPDSELFLSHVVEADGIVNLETHPYAREQFPEGLRWLFGLGLLVPVDWETVIVPREVMIAIRGGTPIKRFTLTAPEPQSLRGAGLATRRAGFVEMSPPALLDTMSAICHTTERDKITPLRTDGMSVKDVRNIAKELGLDEATAARLIELCSVSQLVSADLRTDRITPTPAFDEWSNTAPIERWLSVVRDWSAYRTSLSRVVNGETRVAPLSAVFNVDDNAVWRRGLVMRALLSGPEGDALDPKGITANATWKAPGRWVDTPDAQEAVDAILEEAALLGLLRGGVLTQFGRAALAADASPDSLAELLASVFPPTITTFTVQADLTALAPLELQSAIRARLAGCADLESRGSASLYRFTESSLRRAFDLGHSRDDIVSFLEQHAIPSVPQPLLYLVDDVARRYGRAVVGSMHTYLRVSDEALLAEIVRTKKVSKLGLRQIAPTVAVTMLAAAKLMKGLREAGFLPVEEGSDGVIVSGAAQNVRADTRMSWGHRGRHQSEAIWRAAMNDASANPTLDGFSPKIVSVVHRLRSV